MPEMPPTQLRRILFGFQNYEYTEMQQKLLTKLIEEVFKSYLY